jgi:hypothetical protein
MSAGAPHNRRTARGRFAAIGAATAAAALVAGWPGVAAFAPRCSAATTVTAQAQQQQPAPSSTSAPKAAQPKANAKTPKNVEPLPPSDAAPVLGKKVVGPNGEDLGLIVDVLVDADGQPQAAVIDFGGFLGVGSRKIAIDWKALDFTGLARTGTIELGLDREQIAATPEYKPGPPGAVAVTAPPAPAPPVDTHK